MVSRSSSFILNLVTLPDVLKRFFFVQACTIYLNMKLQLCKTNPPLGALIVYHAVKKNLPSLDWAKENILTVTPEIQFRSNNSISRYLARHFELLYGHTLMEQCQIDHWLTFSIGPLACAASFKSCITYLEKSLAPVTYLVGNQCSIADIIVWSTLYNNVEWNKLISQGDSPDNLSRWYSLISSLNFVSEAVSALPPDSKGNQGTNTSGKCKDEGKFVELPGAEPGKVVVRFPPEASGYLHIGHAKAALLNQYYQETFNGKLIMRFDDTNPAKEKIDFEKVILEDLELLQIKPDEFTHTSNYFDLLLSMCETLIKDGKAYVDDTDPEVMKKEREQRLPSKNRNNSVEVNMELWKEMVKGSEIGQKCCVRAKIDMASDNGCMRDPAIYRCKVEIHPRTGDKFKVYPTYDFACPIVDSLEGVTHCLRTTEYHDRDEQFYWFIDTLKLRKPYIWEYARLNMTNTVLSKRKLRWFVENGYVDGWDDPRFPTVRGVLRRGMSVEGLKQFVIAQGSSRSVVVMEWDKIWSFNKKVIDPIAPRYTTIHATKHVQVHIEGVLEEELKAPKHPKNPEVGEKTFWLGPKLLIDECDAVELKEGENVTFINWGNIKVSKLVKENGQLTKVLAVPNLDNKEYKKTLKLTWLADTSKSALTPCICVYFDHIISKPVLGKDEDFKQYLDHATKLEVPMLGDPELRDLKKSDVIQLQRRGFFICDSPYKPPSLHTGRESPLILFAIPDGHSKPMPTSGLPVKVEGIKKEDFNQQHITSVKNSALNSDIKQQDNISKDFTGTSKQEISDEIIVVGNKIRNLKADKADKNRIADEVKHLLQLKNTFKQITGEDWKPLPSGIQQSTMDCKKVTDLSKSESKTENDSSIVIGNLSTSIKEQGNLVRQLKSSGASKEETNGAVQKLLALKNEYKTLTGTDYPSENRTSNSREKHTVQKQNVKQKENKKSNENSNKKEQSQASKNKISQNNDGDTNMQKKVTRLGLEAKKEENLPDWYSQVIVKGELIEYYDVSGCYILRPWAYSIWETIKSWFDGEIKKLGVKNCYFPIFVSKSVLEKEKTHIADFAPEVAWVTKSGDSDLAEPIAIRPTSETVMYPAYAKWVQSYRDLPIKLNQWNNVVRWEFKHPQPFLRTREFLWQEGHTAYATNKEAEEEVQIILELYAKIYEELLAIPVVQGKKTEKEKFAGGDFTYTLEAYISASGRAIQGATSHHLGQNFSKMFDIIFEDPETKEKRYVYQNSWGITTRTIGVLIMVHADNQGLVLPPKVATIQVVIVPCGITSSIKNTEGEEELINACKVVEKKLLEADIRVYTDSRDNYSPGWKFNHWELKGVPLRIEIGPKDLKNSQIMAVRRDNGNKETIPNENIVPKIKYLLENIQSSMLQKATEELNKHIVTCKNWTDFCNYLDQKNLILSPFCGDISCEDNIKLMSTRDGGSDVNAPSMGAKSLCIPFKQPNEDVSSKDSCINPKCNNEPKFYTLFGRSY